LVRSWRRHRETDDLLVLQSAQQARELILRHRRVGKLQAEHAAAGATDNRGLIFVEQRRDVAMRASGTNRTSARGAAAATGSFMLKDAV
jgi:hypothetical protein